LENPSLFLLLGTTFCLRLCLHLSELSLYCFGASQGLERTTPVATILQFQRLHAQLLDLIDERTLVHVSPPALTGRNAKQYVHRVTLDSMKLVHAAASEPANLEKPV
jgi:hypothetical protein